MKNTEKANLWFRRARANLFRAKSIIDAPEIFYEDYCFDAQQSAEKALKSLCIAHNINFPKTHSIDYLIELLEKKSILIPDDIKQARILTDYAVDTRYPDNFDLIDEAEYQKAIEIAENVLKWVEKKLTE
jgi:HEPN domain-containing protein